MSSWTAGLEGRLRRAPLLWPALALLAGVGLAPLAPAVPPLLAIPGVAVVFVVAWRRPGLAPLALALVLLGAGVARA